MRRLARHLFTLASAVSLLLFFAACVLWVMSYWVSDGLVRRKLDAQGAQTGWVAVCSLNGSLVFSIARLDAPRTDGRKPPHGLAHSRFPADSVRLYDPQAVKMAAGFGSGTSRAVLGPAYPRNWFTYRIVVVPWYAVLLGTALPPLLWHQVWRRRRWSNRQGHCPQCGYDLRASPERCPECGTTTEVAT